MDVLNFTYLLIGTTGSSLSFCKLDGWSNGLRSLTTHLFQCTDLVAGGIRERLSGAAHNSDEQIQALLVLGQQGGRRLVVLPKEQANEPGLRPQQGGAVWATPLQEAIQERK